MIWKILIGLVIVSVFTYAANVAFSFENAK